MFGTTGQFAMQVGGYEGATNPSMALELDDPTNIVEIAKALGHALPWWKNLASGTFLGHPLHPLLVTVP